MKEILSRFHEIPEESGSTERHRPNPLTALVQGEKQIKFLPKERQNIENIFMNEKLLMIAKNAMGKADMCNYQKSHLTPNEVRTLHDLSQGKSNMEIAYERNGSDQTIKNILYVLYRKLDVSNRVGAVVEAMKLGYLNDDIEDNTYGK